MQERTSRNSTKLDALFESPFLPDLNSTTLSSPINTLPFRAYQNQQAAESNPSNIQNSSDHKMTLRNMNCMNGALIDLELYQTRYCSRLFRKSCKIECLLSLDHVNGDYIELRACAPESMREELFYIVQDLNIFVQNILNDSCGDRVNLELHYLSFKPMLIPDMSVNSVAATINLGVVSYDSIHSPKEIICLEFEASHSQLVESKLNKLICCGSVIIEKNFIYGIDLPLSYMKTYTKRMLSVYLDKADPMGLDWSILAVVLGLQELLPKIDELANQSATTTIKFSKTACVLNEWQNLKQDQATIRNLVLKIKELDRKDVYDMMLNSIDLYQVNVSKDSGIQNSNQTLASLK